MAINREDLGRRIVVGAGYVAIMIASTLLSLFSTIVVIALTAALCCYEFLRMCRMNGHHPFVRIGTVTAGLIPLALVFFTHTNHILFGPLAVAFLGSCVACWRYFGDPEVAIEDLALTLFGFLYTGLLLCGYVLVRGYVDDPGGALLGFILFASVCVNDGFAYLGGSAFGRHGFAPKISPKKSWEGVACGIVGCIAVWMLAPLLVPECGFGYAWAALTGFLVGVAGIIGDLMESHIKRGFSVKDSGDIMPGHGGLLDRSDSLIFACVAAYGTIAAAPFATRALEQVLGGVL